jgi:hypothetical protein
MSSNFVRVLTMSEPWLYLRAPRVGAHQRRGDGIKKKRVALDYRLK